MAYKIENVDAGDYVQLYLCDEWYKVTKVYPDSDYIDIITDFGTPTDAHISDVSDIRLPSEMDYAF
jgi:hypothetical protein